MKRRQLVSHVAAASMLALSSVALAQPGGNGEGRRPQLPKLLRDDAPKVGDALPDVQMFTDTGDEFRTSLLKGKYTVIVFGCLT